MLTLIHAVYGHIPPDLADVPPGSVQCSPLFPGSTPLAALAPASCAGIAMHAPASTVERRHVMALALRALGPGAPLTVLAANNKGGTRLANELEAFGCTVELAHRRHHRIAHTTRPENPAGLDDAIAAGEPRLLPDLGLWSQPGLFSWDCIDPGSQLLLDHLPALEGRGADLGCGIGVLARAILLGGRCTHLTLIDNDARAVALARRNMPESVAANSVTSLGADVRTAKTLPTGLDFVVMNPPFHAAGEEDRALGLAFIQKAAAMLRPGGVLWLTANRHLPYEATLKPLFQTVDQIAQANGYKIYAAKKSTVAAKASAPAKARK